VNLLKVKLTFEPSSLAQVAGIAALDDREFVHRSLELNARGRRFIAAALLKLGYEAVPSEANFLMVPLESASAAASLTEALLKRGIIVRPLGAFGLPKCVRISTGSDEDNCLLVEALEQLHMKEEVECRS
jgi:histidinol-phosphate aminotransferase